MDPFSIIGVAGAIASLIDLGCRCVREISHIRAHLESGYLSLAWLDLQSQLVALNTALLKIQEWLDAVGATSSADAHHQLVMDMDMSLSCCRLLVEHLDKHVNELKQKDYGKFGLQQKFRGMMALDGKGIEDVRKMMDRQTMALTLLLVACNSKTATEQKQLLERRSNRHVFRRLQDDSSSLRALDDNASTISYVTDNLSRLSLKFGFDAEIFRSRVYERVMRGSMKSLIRRPAITRPKFERPPQKFLYDEILSDTPIPYMSRKERQYFIGFERQ
ncbi:hypothetical protein EJ04DRAFT_500503 [Polyplosphaeria fusca]|uniref:Uncharacterized protein n=1 Tax=Polyplosphaeria fusca TaxID=682080 RepID=A0A9P4UZQ2_9PLEO|nr:hypothetical protein EJ04DRAFT_500503 [Polyplosphaeria fusca]